MAKTDLGTTQVKYIAKLANIPLKKNEASQLAKAFNETLSIINNLNELKLDDVEPTHQVTGLENILRDDEIDQARSFSQEEALKNAKRSYQGYFVVEQVIDREGES